MYANYHSEPPTQLSIPSSTNGCGYDISTAANGTLSWVSMIWVIVLYTDGDADGARRGDGPLLFPDIAEWYQVERYLES